MRTLVVPSAGPLLEPAVEPGKLKRVEELQLDRTVLHLVWGGNMKVPAVVFDIVLVVLVGMAVVPVLAVVWRVEMEKALIVRSRIVLAPGKGTLWRLRELQVALAEEGVA